jgi:hypothetical protein
VLRDGEPQIILDTDRCQTTADRHPDGYTGTGKTRRSNIVLPAGSIGRPIRHTESNLRHHPIGPYRHGQSKRRSEDLPRFRDKRFRKPAAQAASWSSKYSQTTPSKGLGTCQSVATTWKSTNKKLRHKSVRSIRPITLCTHLAPPQQETRSTSPLPTLRASLHR